MSMCQQQRVAGRSSWTNLPVSLLQQIAALLARDGVASIAKVWPEAEEDEKMKSFVPGGMPICAICFRHVVNTSLSEFVLHEDPTGVLALLPDDDVWSTDMVSEDVVTLFVRGMVDMGCKPQDSDTCLLCTNKPDFETILCSQMWQSSLSKYTTFLAGDLIDFHGDMIMTSNHMFYTEELIRSDFLPLLCPRCGNLHCDHGSECEWFCGEERAVQQFQKNVVAKHEMKVHNMGPCGCKETRKPYAKHRASCACLGCNNMPAKFCNFCGRCCRDACCYHTHPPKQARIYHRFIRVINELEV